MLNKLQKRNSDGFTIIEIIIVLAIAALILLIVLLAVPALQRNSRNTQRKNDVGRVASAAQTVVDNNNGSIAALTSANLQAELGNIGYYTSGNITVTGAAPAAATNTTTVDTVHVYTDGTCAAVAGGQGATSTAAVARGIAITYSTEGGGARIPDCNSE